jgi:methyl acetate hydrolase
MWGYSWGEFRSFLCLSCADRDGSGSGLFTTSQDYLSFLRGILHCSPTARTKPAKPLLSPASYKALFEPALHPTAPGYNGPEELYKMMKGQHYHLPEPKIDTVQHSAALALYLADSDFGRPASVGRWDGAWKTIFFVDPVRGVAVSKRTFSRFRKQNLEQTG